ncbi:MAG: hypothetical protein IJ086_15905 [Clostridium sp.]|nr:hypothetical protein [Clostridium sp.]MBQ9000159.1 hypothetical protein [Clostridium sp.]
MTINLENYNLIKKESNCEIYINKEINFNNDNGYEYSTKLNVINTETLNVTETINLELFKDEIYSLPNNLCKFTGYNITSEQKIICYVEGNSAENYSCVESVLDDGDDLHYRMLKAWGFEDEDIDLFF